MVAKGSLTTASFFSLLSGSLSVRQSNFTNNTAYAIVNVAQDQVHVNISETFFLGNRMSKAPILFTAIPSLDVSDSIFVQNTGLSLGGAIAVHLDPTTGDGSGTSRVSITDSVFAENSGAKSGAIVIVDISEQGFF